MRRIIPILLALIFTLSCSVTAPTSQASNPSGSTPTSGATANDDTPLAAENTATATLPVEPAPTSTRVPPSPRWYWSVDDSDTTKVIAVNQFGERRELGVLENADDLHTTALSIDHERALLFLDSNNILRVYLLTPDGMQQIAFPTEPFPFTSESDHTSRAIIAVHEDHVVFSYVTEEGSNVAPDMGPIFFIDLAALTMQQIDKRVSRAPYANNRSWFHASEDGRYLRYLNGDSRKMEIRELDMVSGDVRTLYTTTGSSFGIYASPQGDLWYLRNAKLLIDLHGNQKDLTDESLTQRPLRDGRVMVYPRNCVDDCEIKILTAFGNDAELTYHLPWAIEEGAFSSEINQLLPDQSVVFVGKPYVYFSNPPSTAQSYPGLLEQDAPLFRLTPDGASRLIGIYTGNVSDDGSRVLVRSTDQTSYFIYDVIADRPLFDMPADASLEYYYTMTYFLDMGVLVNLDASVPDQKDAYRSFRHAFVYKTSTALVWEDVNQEILNCPDLLEDATLICWFYRTDYNFDLVRFDPAAGTKTPLLENVWLIEYIP